MEKQIILLLILAAVLIIRAIPITEKELEIINEQNKNAQYAFSNAVEDHINDLTQDREEVRNGLELRGKYSYSDGYFKRTVYYIADMDGYRVLKQEVERLKEGPEVNPYGTASVVQKAHDHELRYRIQAIPEPRYRTL